ncbi:Putative lipid kinase BmrU [Bacillus sp. THAF10]|uniref:diacylglycerol/lipid kinase family protein n=1 Tax=Bacillus sp. THAF10 TaxID=2587848 RepID=UPI00126871A1|nr:diacylglycerol kinase family protein [Bacillus sp. THAF10]QFT90139.1 Putative lipid kinase BmrU [Bacillus sp. THAF10]
MNKVAVIVNPNAGNGKLLNHLDEIEGKLRSVFQEVSIYRTKQEGEGAKIARKIASSTDLLIAAGGDGTVHELINAISPLEERPVFAVIPAGTCNDFSRTLGMFQHPLKAVEQIVEQRVLKVDIGKSEDAYFSNFWGIGLVSKVADRMESSTKQLLGRLSYYISAGQTMLEEEPIHIKVESAEQFYEGAAVMMLVGNGAFLGGIQSFFPTSDIQDEHFDVLIVKETSLSHLWTWIQTRFQKDLPLQNQDNLIFFRTKELKVAASPQQKIDTDGESRFRTPAVITILPAHLEVVVGEYPIT